MLAYIIGRNRVVIGKVRLKDWERFHWYLSGTQLYKMYPDQMTRVIRTKYGHPIKDEESMAWHENSIIPYHPRGGLESYGMDKQLADIREHMLMVPDKKKVQIGNIVAKNRGLIKELRPMIPIIIGAVIFLWVWLR